MAPKCAAPTLHILRGSLKSYPANGHVTFVPQIRKLVFEYCDYWPSSTHTRTFLRKHVEQLARDNAHVEIVVRQRKYRQPIVRGFYSQSPLCFTCTKYSNYYSEWTRKGRAVEWI